MLVGDRDDPADGGERADDGGGEGKPHPREHDALHRVPVVAGAPLLAFTSAHASTREITRGTMYSFLRT
jgi:hypothetical protein